jgi:hypothetical protein
LFTVCLKTYIWIYFNKNTNQLAQDESNYRIQL